MTEGDSQRVEEYPTQIRIFTLKQGLLSSFGHNLLFDCACVTKIGGAQVRASVVASQLELVGAVIGQLPASPGAQVETEALSADHHGQVLRAMHRDVLRSDRYPTVDFTGVADHLEHPRCQVVGQLSLCGETHSLSLGARRTERGWVAEVELAPSAWGIKPYRAMLGALRLQDLVRVQCRVER